MRVCISGQSEGTEAVWGTQAVSTLVPGRTCWDLDRFTQQGKSDWAAQWRELRWEAFVGWRPSARVPAPAPFRQYLFPTLKSDYDVAESKICKALAP